MDIDTADAPPVSVPAYQKLSVDQRHAFDKCIDKLLTQGVIRPSDSEYSSPPVLVRKNDDSFRLVINFKRLNEQTKPQQYVIPAFDELKSSLTSAEFLSKLDLISGFFQTRLNERSIPKTAFWGSGFKHRSKFEFVTCPQGCRNGPAFFQRLMERVLKPVLWKTCIIFFDDILIFSKNAEEHAQHLAEVLRLLKQAGLRVNTAMSKTEFFKTSVKFCGHIVSQDGISADPDKIQAIQDHPTPKTRRQLLSFLAFANFLNRYTYLFADAAKALYALTSDKVEFVWKPEHQEAFQRMKSILASPPVLSLPQDNGEWFVHCDASTKALGAVLIQRVDGRDYLVAAASKALTGAATRYSATELEAMAVHWSVTKQFKSYVYGTRFTVVTDHRALLWLRSLKSPSRRLWRWIEELAEYDFDVVHCPGMKQIVRNSFPL
jgi:hypothetical protein